ncbi:hypothetical protein KUTeg_011866, partial [Tegillarca granosa]
MYVHPILLTGGMPMTEKNKFMFLQLLATSNVQSTRKEKNEQLKEIYQRIKPTSSKRKHELHNQISAVKWSVNKIKDSDNAKRLYTGLPSFAVFVWLF